MGILATSEIFAPGSAFSIDGIHSDTWKAYLRGWSIPVLPTPRSTSQDIPGLVGKADLGAELSSKILSLDLSIFEPDRPRMHALLRMFGAAIDPRSGPHQVELVDEWPGWYLKVQPTSDLPAQPSSGIVTVQFTLNLEAHDPHWYSRSPQSITMRIAGPEPFTLDNLGSVSTPLRITVRTRPSAPAALTGFTLDVAGEALTYTGAIADGDEVVVDTGAMTVEHNGVNAIAAWSGEMPELPTGEPSLSWTDPLGAGAEVTFDYTERLI